MPMVMTARAVAVVAMLATALAVSAVAEQCGSQAGSALCPNCLCCSQWGWCGTTAAYCGDGCQSQCTGSCTPPPPPPTPSPPPPPPPPTPAGGGGVASIVSETLFNQMLLHRNDAACPASGFYTYAAFLAAADAFPGFGTTGGADDQKRELAAFLAQTSHETTGGWATAPDGPYAWGYCFKEEVGGAAGAADYCQPSTQWPCAAGEKYYGRGPIQLSWNYNYGPAGDAIGEDLLGDPGLVAGDVKVAFETALWFWMTPQPPKPSCHDAINTGRWTPSAVDTAAGRLPGYGVVTNIINGGLECGHGADDRVANRIGFYKRYCDMLGVSYGDNLDCYGQRPFGNAILLAAQTETTAATSYSQAADA